jgi:hypothetical protein
MIPFLDLPITIVYASMLISNLGSIAKTLSRAVVSTSTSVLGFPLTLTPAKTFSLSPLATQNSLLITLTMLGFLGLKAHSKCSKGACFTLV